MTAVQVKVTEKLSVYWNYQVWQLGVGETVSGGLADYLLATSSPVEVISAEPVAVEEDDDLPDGPIPAVEAWVGEDLERAAHALEVEQAKGDQARTTLVAALEKLLAVE